ncbi:MAG: DUF4364 family protein [Clostridiaceae bacterium]|nr:DUF4364 family protein [Clostridiaceae bacterium]
MINNDINDITENKLILLFILDKIQIPITNTQLTEIVIKDELMNYFILQQYLSELINTSQIKVYEERGKQLYKLTPQGKQTLSYFVNRVPLSTREKILKSILEKKKEFKKSAEVISNYFPQIDNGYLVECKIVENKVPLIELRITVGTKEQAKHVCKHWKNNYEKIYNEIISSLMLDKNNQSQTKSL